MTQISQSKPLRASGLLILPGCLLAGIGLALFVMPMMFRHIPSDISRIGVLLDAMNSEGANPKVVVFGNSTVMSGIDAQQLSAELPGNPLAWSLSSTGQALTESFMLSQDLHSVEMGCCLSPAPLKGKTHRVQVYGSLGRRESFRPKVCWVASSVDLREWHTAASFPVLQPQYEGINVTHLVESGSLNYPFRRRGVHVVSRLQFLSGLLREG